MSVGPTHPLPNRSEWQHSGPYLLTALVLHAVLLFYPRKPGPEIIPPKPLTVQLADKVAPPQVVPPVPPEKPAAPKPQKEKPVPVPAKPVTPRPILAMKPEQVSTPSAITVPAPPAVVAPSAPPAPTPPPVTASAPATTTPARFNAAYLNNPEPKYPAISRRMGEEGKVLLRVRVTADGRASTVDIEKSSNFERLDEAARQGVAHWRFVPAKRGDEAIEATVIVPIVFRLDN